MNDLELLGRALREELGSPPDAWLRDQRIRFMTELERHRTVPRFRRLASVVAGVLAVAGALVWMATRKAPSKDVARSLIGMEMREPFRFDDGSTLALGPGAVGRLVVDETSVRFELQSGSARFDVVPRQRRVWLVTAGDNEVRVVGTRFSVTYSPSRAFDVEVERGVVSVRRSDRTRVELEAGERLHDRPKRAEVSRASSNAPTDAAANEREPTDAASPEPDSIDRANERELAESERTSEWRSQYRGGRYAESLALIRAEGLDNRLNEVNARTLAEVADAARLGGDPELAVRALLALMRRFPRAPEARDGKFLLGRVHALRGDGGAAISAFEAYLKPGGSTRYENEALGRLIGLYSARGDGGLAREMASRYLRQAPNGPYRRLASSLVQDHGNP